MNQILYISAMIVYLIATLLPENEALNTAVSLLCLLAVLFGLRNVRGPVLFFGIVFLAGGSLLLCRSGANPLAYVTSFGEMIQMVTLFALVPILAFPFRYGNYAEQVRMLIRKWVKGPARLYMLTSGAACFLSSFMNVAALPLSYYAIAQSVSDYPINNKKRYLTRAITHGYAMPLLWSPVTPIVGTVLYLTGTDYTDVLPFLLILSIAGLMLDWSSAFHVIGSRKYRQAMKKTRKETAASEEDHEKRGAPGKLLHLLLAVVLLNVLIACLDQLFSQSFLFLVSVSVIPFAYIWCLLIGKGRSFFPDVRRHFHSGLSEMQNPFFIFLSAGFFITALNVSETDKIVTDWVDVTIQFTGMQLFLVILPLIPFALSFFGLHPAVGLALVSGAIHSDILYQSPVIITLAMLGGAIPAFLMGPYNATLGMMSGIVNESPYKLSGWNFPYTLLYLVLLTVFVQLLYTIR